jgi:thioesterase domain-containing protein
MLVPIQTSGTKPPFFFIHGANGIMPVGGSIAQVLGPDQPFYVINARGFDGKSPPRTTVEEMIPDYLGEILDVAPTGPIVVGGMCWGTMIALEIGRELLTTGRALGPVVLMDPPRVPYGKGEVSQEMGMAVPTGGAAGAAMGPEVEQQLYNYTRGALMTHASIRYNELPFNARDPQQLHIATLAGVACTVALSRFTAKQFLGNVELILNSNVAPVFLNPNMPWQRILPNPRVLHVVPWGHVDMLRSRRFDTARLIKFILDGAFGHGKFHEGELERSFA